MKRFTLVCFLILLSSQVYSGNGNPVFTNIKWYCQDAEAKKLYLKSEGISSFSLKSKPDYQNQIVNQVKHILNEKSGDISICTEGNRNRTDLMFINRKLISISEEIYDISDSRKQEIIDETARFYKRAQVSQNGPYIDYNFEFDNTKVLLIVRPKSGLNDIKIYYYAADLFEYMLLY
ncbi:MAG: hypothetical protein JW982_03590 [Spirochaetes bacterium]|nr:hypothetical protein [Spirochaetota bacterium]